MSDACLRFATLSYLLANFGSPPRNVDSERRLQCSLLPNGSGARLSLPFGRHAGLYVWRVVIREDVLPSRAARAMAIHASRSRHHVS
eukprot:3422649-Pleurochrysis_carterae.AAC.1